MNDPAKTEHLEPDSVMRVWEHALHEENVHADRHNFFLLAQAMLFVFFATLDSETQSWALIAICAFGIALTAMWVMISMRQEEDLEAAKSRLRKYCPEFIEYEDERETKRFRKSGLLIMGRWVPLVIFAAWVVLIVELATR